MDLYHNSEHGLRAEAYAVAPATGEGPVSVHLSFRQDGPLLGTSFVCMTTREARAMADALIAAANKADQQNEARVAAALGSHLEAA